MTENPDDDLLRTPNEIEEVPLKVEITNQPKEQPKQSLTSKDTENPYDAMDISDEEIKSYQEDINAQ